MCKKIENRIRAKLEEKNEDSKISKGFQCNDATCLLWKFRIAR